MRKCSFRLAQLIVPFFESITEQVIPEDLLAVHSEIVRAGEAGSDADVSEDIHCDESVSGVQEGSNDMSINEPVNVPSPVNVRLLDENMLLTTALPTSRGENVEGGIASGRPQVKPEIRNDVLVKKRSKTIEQAAPISVDEAAGSTGCHPQSPPPIVTTVESIGDCGMDVGPVKKKPDMDKQREIQAIKAGLPNKTCLRRRPGHSSLDVTPELLQPDYNVTVEYRKYQRKYPQKKKTSKETNALSTKLGETLLTLNEYFMFLC
ncbi:hypothetical protein IFM89_025914 [Coptis chinensis]|uniref:Uncharacterized protein n=1 Tax=Coptis chinensis TaxID=261450 RepID=A0A835IEW1_9MAGN|nr:hypothetical protein IFM89_025914 [Coptis chinensis]